MFSKVAWFARVASTAPELESSMLAKMSFVEGACRPDFSEQLCRPMLGGQAANCAASILTDKQTHRSLTQT